MKNTAQKAPPYLSAIIPTLNEAAYIEAALDSLDAAAEVIVVDGGSSDGTPELARARGAQVIVTAQGRGRQMNAGAARASGDTLLFLHADSEAPRDFEAQIREVMAKPGTVGGAFRLRVDLAARTMRGIEWAANLRSRLLSLPYGDQGIFVSARAFRAVGGYPDLPIMEDVVLVRRLRRRGRIGVARATVRTSGRRWRTLGLVRASFVNVISLAMYSLGVSPEAIARWRNGVERRACAPQNRRAPANPRE